MVARWTRITQLTRYIATPACWCLLPGTEELIARPVRRCAAPILTPTADLDLLRWLHPRDETTPSAFWTRVVELPSPKRISFAENDRREFVERMLRALRERSATQELIRRALEWQERNLRPPTGDLKALYAELHQATYASSNRTRTSS